CASLTVSLQQGTLRPRDHFRAPEASRAGRSFSAADWSRRRSPGPAPRKQGQTRGSTGANGAREGQLVGGGCPFRKPGLRCRRVGSRRLSPGWLARAGARATGLMRLFVAVPIPDPARGQILRLLGQFRDGSWPVRWVPDEGLHLTLKFFGEVGPERLDVIVEAI